MAGERIPAAALHLADIAAGHIAEVLHESIHDPGQDLEALVDRAHRSAIDQLRGTNVLAFLAPLDAHSLESFASAVRLCNEALLGSLTQHRLRDRRLAVTTRARIISVHANALISRWANDRGMDIEEIRRLKAKGGVR